MRLARRTVAVVLAFTAPALASDHLARVNEVLLSYDGDAGAQFVEIEDPTGEDFPAGGYGLFVYEADGATQAHYQVITLGAGTTSRMTLATEAARARFGLEIEGSPPELVINLGAALPANGSACFRRQGIDLSCLTWGAATAPISLNGNVAGPAPADGMSLQRQTVGDCAGLGAPTPHATNAVLTCAEPEPPDDGGPDAGTGAHHDDDGGCAASRPDGWLATVAVMGFAVFARPLRRRHGRR